MSASHPLRLARLGWLCLAFLTFTCAPANAEEKKELTLHQVSLQVEDAMLRFRNASIAGDVTTAQREAIEEAYKAFGKVYKTAVEDAGGKKQAKKTPASVEVKAAAEKVIASVAALH